MSILALIVLKALKAPNKINELIRSKVLVWHFLLVFVCAFFICSLFYWLIIPIIFWMILGESAESDRIASLPFNMFIGEWSTLILIIFLSIVFILINLKRLNYQKAKSYLLTGIIISILYLFSYQIANLLIAVFQ